MRESPHAENENTKRNVWTYREREKPVGLVFVLILVLRVRNIEAAALRNNPVFLRFPPTILDGAGNIP
jgi:hypothetical protein